MAGGRWSYAAAVTAGIGIAVLTTPGTAYAVGDETAPGTTAEHSPEAAEHPDQAEPREPTSASSIAGPPGATPSESTDSTDGDGDDDGAGAADDPADDQSPADGVSTADPDEPTDSVPAAAPAEPAAETEDPADRPLTRPVAQQHDKFTDTAAPPKNVVVHTDYDFTVLAPKTRSTGAVIGSEPRAAAQITTTAAQTPNAAGAAVVAAVPAPPAVAANPVKALIDSFFYVVNSIICPNPPALPTNPFQLLAYEFFRRIEIAFGLPVVGTATTTIADPGEPVYAPGIPSPADVAHTPYGDIGKWMLQPDGQISNWGGQKYGGRTLLEPINIIIVDPTSTSVAESSARLTAELTQAGFPIQLGHSTGFSGLIDGQVYSQQPTGIIDAYADQFFLFPQDHARAFGPDPLETSAGFVWTLAVSREIFGFYGLLPAHLYVSFNAGRDNLATKLVSAGGTLVGFVPLHNAYDSLTVETGDTDGYAAVIRFND